MNNKQKLIVLMTPRDWQMQANKEAAGLVGSPDYYAKAAEARRYGMLADALEAAQVEIQDLLDQRRALMQATPSQAAAERDQALARLEAAQAEIERLKEEITRLHETAAGDCL